MSKLGEVRTYEEAYKVYGDILARAVWVMEKNGCIGEFFEWVVEKDLVTVEEGLGILDAVKADPT